MLFVVSAELQAVLQWLSTSWSVCLSYITGTWQMVSCTTSADLHWVVGCHWPNLIANLITWSRRASTVWMQRSAARSLSYLVVCSCTVRPQQVSWSVLYITLSFTPSFILDSLQLRPSKSVQGPTPSLWPSVGMVWRPAFELKPQQQSATCCGKSRRHRMSLKELPWYIVAWMW